MSDPTPDLQTQIAVLRAELGAINDRITLLIETARQARELQASGHRREHELMETIQTNLLEANRAALEKAEGVQSAYRSSQNEWRGALSDAQTHFVTRTEHEL